MKRFWWEASYNFNERQLRGAAFNVLPFFRVFPPAYGRKRLTLHFGWLWWTVGVHIIEDGLAPRKKVSP